MSECLQVRFKLPQVNAHEFVYKNVMSTKHRTNAHENISQRALKCETKHHDAKLFTTDIIASMILEIKKHCFISITFTKRDA